MNFSSFLLLTPIFFFCFSSLYGLKHSAFQTLQKVLQSNHLDYILDKKTDLIILKSPHQKTKITFMPHNNFFWIDLKVHFVKQPFHYNHGQFMIPKSITSIIKNVFEKEAHRSQKKSPPIKTTTKNSASQNFSKSLFLKNIPTVVIDPGHGGKDYGAIGYCGLREKDLNLKVSLLLKKYLIQKGFRVILTRTKDYFLTLKERTNIANTKKNDLFISIHANASSHKQAHGLEIYYLSDACNNHKISSELTPFMMKNFFSFTPPQKKAPHVFQILTELVLNHHRRLSKTLGTVVLNTVISKTKQLNRGVKQSQFYVLKHTNSPSILVEIGFVTHKEESQFLKSKISLIAQSIAQGIALYTQEHLDLQNIS